MLCIIVVPGGLRLFLMMCCAVPRSLAVVHSVVYSVSVTILFKLTPDRDGLQS